MVMGDAEDVGTAVQDEIVDETDEVFELDPRFVTLGDPIVGMEKVTWQKETGAGALDPRVLPSPVPLSKVQREKHDLTHLPYEPSCDICVCVCRHVGRTLIIRNLTWRNGECRWLSETIVSRRTIETPRAALSLFSKVYPYKLFFACICPAKGPEPSVVKRVCRFIRDAGLTHFAYRSDREHPMSALLEKVWTELGRNGARAEPQVEDDPEAHWGELVSDQSSPAVTGSHTAVPEQTHPGESASNGLAERAVQAFTNQFRTLKAAFEGRLKQRVPVSHVVMSWMVEHVTYCLNRFMLGTDGHTAYGRLHGREGSERICEFGEHVLWYVPKKARGKLNARWRHGTFLGRSLSSDQNYIGLISGEVTVARAMVRMMPSMRWDLDRVSKISCTPMTFKINDLDHIESLPNEPPHKSDEPNREETEEVLAKRKLKMTTADIVRHGYTRLCNKCSFLQAGRHTKAAQLRHTEECRQRFYDLMRLEGDKKFADADQEGLHRTQTREDQHKAQAQKSQNSDFGVDVTEALAPDDAMEEQPAEIANDDIEPDCPDTEVRDVEDDADADLELVSDVSDDDSDWSENNMSDLVTCLQLCGVDVAGASAFRVKAIKASKKVGVSRLYGHGTITDAANAVHRNLNIQGLDAFDLRTCKPNGEAWNFNSKADRLEALEIINRTKPRWIICSPPCTAFSIWNESMNYRKMDPEEVKRRKQEGRMHLHFALSICKLQLDQGRHFLFEHPATASTWKDPVMLNILGLPGVNVSVSDQCMTGLTTKGPDGIQMPAKKSTRWASSSHHMIKRLSQRCSKDHDHQMLVGGRAKAAQDYPMELIKEILRGIRATEDHEEQWDPIEPAPVTTAMACAGLLQDVPQYLYAVYQDEAMESQTCDNVVTFRFADGTTEKIPLVFANAYRDECTGVVLPQGHVKTAVTDEIKYLCDTVWIGVPLAKAHAETEGKIIASRWIDSNKHDAENPNIRCRRVAQEVGHGKAEPGFYAATPPLEAKRMLFSQWAMERTRGKLELCLSFIDVRKAYFNARPKRRLYIRLPTELGLKGIVGRLERCIYGTRDAGALWEECYANALIHMGFEQGKASPCPFHQPKWH